MIIVPCSFARAKGNVAPALSADCWWQRDMHASVTCLPACQGCIAVANLHRMHTAVVALRCSWIQSLFWWPGPFLLPRSISLSLHKDTQMDAFHDPCMPPLQLWVSDKPELKLFGVKHCKHANAMHGTAAACIFSE